MSHPEDFDIEKLKKLLVGRCSGCTHEVKVLAVSFVIHPTFAIEFVLAPHRCPGKKEEG